MERNERRANKRAGALALGTGLLMLGLVGGCTTPQPVYPLPQRHPELFSIKESRITCSRCHAAQQTAQAAGAFPYARFDHAADFYDTHRQVAYQSERVCAICHAQAFCNDCHASNVEIPPSTRFPSGTYRQLPHRGDFISRHQLEGRIDPSSCNRCHGNPKSSKVCAPCHGK